MDSAAEGRGLLLPAYLPSLEIFAEILTTQDMHSIEALYMTNKIREREREREQRPNENIGFGDPIAIVSRALLMSIDW